MDCMRTHFQPGVLLAGRYKTVCPLNHGSFGLVFKVKDITTNEYVALKCLTKTSAAATNQSNFAVDDGSEELAIHRLIGTHPNVVNLFNYFETDNHVYLVLEYCPNGDLYEAIRLGRGPLETENIRDAMLQLIDAVDFMHSKGVYHRDIKPENIFLSNTGAIKLGDFGLATKEEMSMEAAVGSDRYMAPEQMDPPEGGYSPAKADVWALGVCLLNILFARNPFATPTYSDPLFADFVGDKQTLFDVFPNMSQDTFDVLMYCLAIDPANRSLELTRDAIKKAISFTTDDEALDDFCAAPVTMATANREPLRTPSISSPQIDSSGAFPWAKALAMTSPVRQLSVIKDVELSDALFEDDQDTLKGPLFTREIYPSSQVDNASLVSFVDSGLGLSVKSINLSLDPSKLGRSKPVPISGSLPATAARPIPSLAAVFGKGEYQSKSWSDIWDEDFAEANEVHIDANDEDFFHRDSLDSLSSASSGSDTPRVGLSELRNPEMVNNSRSRAPETALVIDERVSDETGFLFEEHHPEPMAVKMTTPLPPHKYSPPSKRSAEDKWAALGDRRRATPTPIKLQSRAVSSADSPALSTPSSKRFRFNNPRKGINWSLWSPGYRNVAPSPGPLSPDSNKKQWNLSKDWRKHDSSFQDAPAAERSRPLEWVWRL